jgi:hypothetical protein
MEREKFRPNRQLTRPDLDRGGTHSSGRTRRRRQERRRRGCRRRQTAWRWRHGRGEAGAGSRPLARAAGRAHTPGLPTDIQARWWWARWLLRADSCRRRGVMGQGARCSSHVRFVDRGAAFAGSSPGGVGELFSLGRGIYLGISRVYSEANRPRPTLLCMYAGRQVSCKYKWLMLINAVKSSI